MGCSRKMDTVELQIAAWNWWVVNDYTNMPSIQPTNDSRYIGGALLFGKAKPEIIGAGLQDYDVCTFGYVAVEAVEHSCGGIGDDSGVGDFGVDAALAKDLL